MTSLILITAEALGSTSVVVLLAAMTLLFRSSTLFTRTV